MSSKLQTVIVAVLLSIHFMLGYGAIKAISPTYDEPVHFAAGYSYLKLNDYRYNSQDHPPLAKMWAAIPLLFMRASLPIQHPYWQDIRKYQYQFSNIFLYHNKVDAEKMLDAGRVMMMAFSLALGLLIFVWSRRVAGPAAGLFALALWCFMPAFIANTTLITTDMALTLFFFASVYYFQKICEEEDQKRREWKTTLLFGVSLGLCFASKYSAIGILPVLFLIWALNSFDKKLFVRLLAGFGVAIIVLWSVYRFNPLGDFYFFGLNKVISGINSGRSSFLMGQHSTTGWLYYFPVTFILKTPLPFLAMLAAVLLFRRTWSRKNIMFLMLPAAAFFAISCLSKVQIGHRHILPVYPFLIVLVSGLAAYPLAKAWKYLLSLGLVLFAVLTLKTYPWYISYFNELAGPRDNSYKYLTDSNVDWGQGLKELAIYLKNEKAGGIYLSYFGTADPSYYGIKYFPIGFVDGISRPYTENERIGDNIDFESQEKILLAVSATNLQATYYADKQVFSFLKDIKPVKVAANSIFVYDLKADPGAYAKFRELLAPYPKASGRQTVDR